MSDVIVRVGSTENANVGVGDQVVIKGEDGFSPVVSFEQIEGGYRLTIVDAQGAHEANILNGAPGQDGGPGPQGIPGVDGQDGSDGFSPTVSVSEITGGHRITITDSTGAHSADVMDGQNGADGQDGTSPTVTFGVISGGHTMTVTDKTHPTGQTINIMDGATQDVSGKADKVQNATTGNFAALDANGNLTDSGHKHSDYLTQHQSLAAYRTSADQDVIDAGKLGTSGDGSNVTAAFTAASSRANIATGEKLSVIFGKITKWFSDLGTAAFRAATNAITQGNTDLIESGAVYTGLAGKYSKPAGGIPESDLSQDVQDKLNSGTSDALPLVGGTMAGAINMDGNRVQNLPTPSASADAASKGYADNIVAVSDTQPTAQENKLWVDTDAGAGASYQVPTVAEMQAADALSAKASEIGIVITGARPSMVVSAGQYVIVRGSTITGVTDGLYTAVNSLSPSTDVTAADLAAVTIGGLNDIRAITTGNFTIDSSFVYDICYVSPKEQNGVVLLYVYLKSNFPANQYTRVGVVYPPPPQEIIEMVSYGNQTALIDIYPNGNLDVYAYDNNFTGFIRDTMPYFL